MIADSDETVSRLLSRLARLAEGSGVLLDALRGPAASELFDAHGLSVARRLTRMTAVRPQPLLMGDSVRAAMSFEWG